MNVLLNIIIVYLHNYIEYYIRYDYLHFYYCPAVAPLVKTLLNISTPGTKILLSQENRDSKN